MWKLKTIVMKRYSVAIEEIEVKGAGGIASVLLGAPRGVFKILKLGQQFHGGQGSFQFDDTIQEAGASRRAVDGFGLVESRNQKGATLMNGFEMADCIF